MSTIIFILGLIIGSFLNVCIYRIPQNQSIAFPSSHCTSCGKPLKIIHLIPILSYIFLRGKCANCQEKVSLIYPIVEILTGSLFLFTYLKVGLNFLFIKYIFLISILIIITFIDLKTQIIPDGLIIIGLITGMIFLLINSNVSFLSGIIGALIGGGLFLLIAVLSNGGMGGGDIKLITVIGLYLGWQKVLLTIFLSSLVGGLLGMILIITKIKGRKDPIPFGPFLSISAMVAIFFEKELLNIYLKLFL